MNPETHVGSPRSRVDGRLKVTGEAKYAAEFNVAGLAHGVVVSGAIAKGRDGDAVVVVAAAAASVRARATFDPALALRRG